MKFVLLIHFECITSVTDFMALYEISFEALSAQDTSGPLQYSQV